MRLCCELDASQFLCVSLSAGIRPKSKGVAWGNVVWHDFFERLPRRPRKKLGADAGRSAAVLVVFGGWFGRWFGSVSRGRFGIGLALILGSDLGFVSHPSFASFPGSIFGPGADSGKQFF